MENNDSPYIYEKPLRSELKQRSKRLAGLSALGLIGMVGIFGGSAIANTIVSDNTANTANTANEADAVGVPLVSTATIEPASDQTPLVSIPLQESKPKPNSVKVELPALPNQSYTNTSSATPSIGSGSYASGSAPAKIDARGERQKQYESGDNNNEAEYEND